MTPIAMAAPAIEAPAADPWASRPRLVVIHRMLAAAVAEAGRTLGRGVSFDALLAGLTDGRDELGHIDVLGITTAARGFGLILETLPAGSRPALGSAALICIDAAAARDAVLFFPRTELASERRAMRLHPQGLCQAFAYDDAQVPHGDDVVWLRVDRTPYTQDDGALRDKLPSRADMGWLWDVLRAEQGALKYALLASFGSALLGLAMPLFSMVLFNTVAPNGATATLMTLIVGMLIALAADFTLRELRAYIVDVTARRMDVVLSRRTYEHLLDIRLEAWSGAAGTQADMLRGFSTVQEMFTSGVLLLFVDLPFGLMALAMVFVVGGHLGWVPLFWVLVMIGIVVRMQSTLERSSRLAMRLGQERHGTLVETIGALESVRAVGGERVLRRRWRDQSTMAAMASGTTRMLSQLSASLTGLCLQLEGLMLLGIGAWMVGGNQLTIGALIAANMLASRALTPFSAIVGLGMRLQSARIAAGYMSRFFKMPRVTSAEREFVARDDYRGAISLDGVTFAYPSARGARATLARTDIEIRAGERVAILGRMGSGKSTLLKLMAGVLAPHEGRVLIDGIDSAQIDLVTRRKVLGYLQQTPVLVTGSLKENIALGHPDASDDEILAAARLAGVDEFARSHPDGYSMRLGERGRGLSEGQKQSVGLAQILLNRTKAILLDEPSSSFDMDAEMRLVRTLGSTLAEHTLVVVTHRPAFLQLVSRVIVLDEGRVVMDGPRDDILRRLSGMAPANTARAA